MTHRSRSVSGEERRKAAAVVECAIILPLLVVATLGVVDVGQMTEVAQTVSEASREGARLAARNETANVSEVDRWVLSYVTNSYPNVSAASLQSALTVNVTSAGNAIPGNDLSSLAPGSEIEVEVDLPFASVRWMNGVTFGQNRTLRTATTVRRE